MGADTFFPRLAGAFPVDSVGAQLFAEIGKRESEFDKLVNHKISGFVEVSRCTHEFFLESIVAASLESQERSHDEESDRSLLFFDFCTVFRTLRATDNLLSHGYPQAGFALLRDLKDVAFDLCAVGNGLSTIKRIHGLDVLDDEVTKNLEFELKAAEQERRRKAEERRIRHLLFQETDGLTPHKEALERWERLFHQEVHGARVSAVFNLMESHRTGTLPIWTYWCENTVAFYCNRFAKISWMFVKLTPLLQRQPGSFGEEWGNKWNVLDESMREYVSTLKNLERDHLSASVDAITYLIDSRFSFEPGTCSFLNCKQFNAPVEQNVL